MIARFCFFCFVFSFIICIVERLLFFQGGQVPFWLHPVNGLLGGLMAFLVESLFDVRSRI